LDMEKLRKLNILGADNQVYNVIKDSIVTLRLKPNQCLNIRKISQQLGTSITPVRSALQRLANEGLVIAKPRIGFFVSGIDENQVKNLFAVRKSLELLALENSINRIDSEAISEIILKLRSALNDPEKTVSSPPYDLDYKLHDLIISSYPNPYLHRMFSQLFSLITRARNVIRVCLPPSEKEWILREAQQHLEVSEQIFMRNLSKARESLDRHIEASCEMICKLLKEIESKGEMSL